MRHRATPDMATLDRRPYRGEVRQPKLRRRSSAVHTVTTARRGASEDISTRTKRYLIMMGIRTFCFGAAVFTHGTLRWASIIGAVILPYLAVVVANAGREPERGHIEPVAPPRHPAIESAKSIEIRSDDTLPPRHESV